MSNFKDNFSKVIFTIGHSNHQLSIFIQLLNKYHIDVLVDIRSHPYSKYAPQFDINNLKKAVKAYNIKYLYLGRELGGRPEGKEFYDINGNIIYSTLAESQFFREALARIEEGLQKFRIALMCSEENPDRCHRYLLVGRTLAANGVIVNHIRGNGELETQNQLKPEIESDSERQLSLF
ncbi:MAG: DUF488 domain-containing protein [Deltaproteobacteria bacterium]|nr:MAG: DUF488 domain-containing protein [Deltaproteobacteria bacterium]